MIQVVVDDSFRLPTTRPQPCLWTATAHALPKLDDHRLPVFRTFGTLAKTEEATRSAIGFAGPEDPPALKTALTTARYIPLHPSAS